MKYFLIIFVFVPVNEIIKHQQINQTTSTVCVCVTHTILIYFFAIAQSHLLWCHFHILCVSYSQCGYIHLSSQLVNSYSHVSAIIIMIPHNSNVSASVSKIPHGCCIVLPDIYEEESNELRL